MYAFGNTAFSLHVVPVVYGGLVLLVFYILIFLLYRSRLLAGLISIILAFLPTFIAANRIGLYTSTLSMFFGVSSVLCYVLWIRKNKFYWLAAACFLLGLGIGSRCQFWWLVSALLIFAIIFYREPLLRIKELSFFKKTLCLFALFISSFPLVLFNIRSQCQTLSFFVKHAVVSSDGISNLNYIQNFKERASELVSLLNSTVYCSANENPIIVYMFIAAVIILLLNTLFLPILTKRKISRVYLFPFIIFLLVFLQSPLTCSGMSALHIFYMLPFALMIIAAAIASCQTRFLRIFFSALLIAAVIFSLRINLISLLGREAHLWTHGGSEVRWNIALDVLGWLKKNGIERVGLGDTGIKDALAYQNGSDKGIEEVFYADFLRKSTSREAKENALRERLRGEKEGYYLFRRYPWAPYFDDFAKIAREENKDMTVAKEFKMHRPRGETVYILYKVNDIVQK
jgi:4-amino-4-deoxy-L-arabinose transferase-like glycosyltransferase